LQAVSNLRLSAQALVPLAQAAKWKMGVTSLRKLNSRLWKLVPEVTLNCLRHPRAAHLHHPERVVISQ
jgi:hypothetical protein